MPNHQEWLRSNLIKLRPQIQSRADDVFRKYQSIPKLNCKLKPLKPVKVRRNKATFGIKRHNSQPDLYDINNVSKGTTERTFIGNGYDWAADISQYISKLENSQTTQALVSFDCPLIFGTLYRISPIGRIAKH